MVHHVWARAVDGRPVFAEPSERRDFVARLSEVLPESGAATYAWALMSNHLHLVVRVGREPLSRLVHRVHTGFAARFNRRSGRQGHVFQSRFGSRLVQDDGDLLGVIRYVHRNPLEAGLVPSLEALERHPWCGHGALLGRRAAHAFESVDEALAMLGEGPAAARRRLREWMASAAPAAEAHERAREDALGELIRRVCAELGVAEVDLRAGRRRPAVSAARARVCERGVRELGLRNRQLARALGLSEGAVSQALRRVSKGRCQTPF